MPSISNLVSAPAPADTLIAPVPAPAPKSRLIKNDPNHVEYATDSTGRRIGAKPITALDMFDLSIVLGENSSNAAALNQALMASSVVSIDGREVFRPVSLPQIRARIQELGFHGYAAASEAVSRFSDDGDVNPTAIKN